MAGTWMLHGEHEFKEFADSIYEVEAHIPSDVYKKATEDTMKELVSEITRILKSSTTAKGGTYDSRSSDYSPGTTNDSTSSTHHITDKDAWFSDTFRKGTDWVGVIQPKPDVKDRAYWIEKGTPDHGPSGDTPLHFYVNGLHIVMAEKPGRDSAFYRSYIEQASTDEEDSVESAQFNFGEPTKVDGLEPLGYFDWAVKKLARRRTFSKNVNRRWKVVLQEQGFEA